MLDTKSDGTPRKSPRHLRRITDAEMLFHEPKKVVREEIVEPGPSPETPTAMIYCYECDAPGPHSFIGRRTVRDSAQTPLYSELVYACAHCKFTRVWGTEAPEEG